MNNDPLPPLICLAIIIGLSLLMWAGLIWIFT